MRHQQQMTVECEFYNDGWCQEGEVPVSRTYREWVHIRKVCTQEKCPKFKFTEKKEGFRWQDVLIRKGAAINA